MLEPFISQCAQSITRDYDIARPQYKSWFASNMQESLVKDGDIKSKTEENIHTEEYQLSLVERIPENDQTLITGLKQGRKQVP